MSGSVAFSSHQFNHLFDIVDDTIEYYIRWLLNQLDPVGLSFWRWCLTGRALVHKERLSLCNCCTTSRSDLMQPTAYCMSWMYTAIVELVWAGATLISWSTSSVVQFANRSRRCIFFLDVPTPNLNRWPRFFLLFIPHVHRALSLNQREFCCELASDRTSDHFFSSLFTIFRCMAVPPMTSTDYNHICLLRALQQYSNCTKYGWSHRSIGGIGCIEAQTELICTIEKTLNSCVAWDYDVVMPPYVCLRLTIVWRVQPY